MRVTIDHSTRIPHRYAILRSFWLFGRIRFVLIQFRNGNPESECVGVFTNALMRSVQLFSVPREHDYAHGVRLWLACLRANVGDWTTQSQAHNYSGFRLVIHQKSDYIPIPVYLENGLSNVYSESGLPFRNWISANRIRPYLPWCKTERIQTEFGLLLLCCVVAR